MKITYDKIANASYVYLSKEKVFKTFKLKEDLLIDIDAKGAIVGIEILDILPESGKTLESLKKLIPTFA